MHVTPNTLATIKAQSDRKAQKGMRASAVHTTASMSGHSYRSAGMPGYVSCTRCGRTISTYGLRVMRDGLHTA